MIDDERGYDPDEEILEAHVIKQRKTDHVVLRLAEMLVDSQDSIEQVKMDAQNEKLLYEQGFTEYWEEQLRNQKNDTARYKDLLDEWKTWADMEITRQKRLFEREQKSNLEILKKLETAEKKNSTLTARYKALEKRHNNLKAQRRKEREAKKK